MNSIVTTLKRHWASLVIVTSLAIGVGIAMTALQPFEYRSGFSVLVIEKLQTGDAFAAAKSAERASLSLGEILYTTSFYDQVRESGLVDPDMFPADETERRSMWQRQIETRIFPDVGMMKIAAYHTDRQKASALALAVATELTKSGSEYLGTGEQIVLKVVDAPLTSKTPVRPNIPTNLALAVLVGFGATLGLHLVRDAQRVVEPATLPVAQAQPAPVVNQPAPPAPTWQPPMPVVTTMYSPNAVQTQRIAPSPASPPIPETTPWEMPDLRRNSAW